MNGPNLKTLNIFQKSRIKMCSLLNKKYDQKARRPVSCKDGEDFGCVLGSLTPFPVIKLLPDGATSLLQLSCSECIISG